MQEIELVCVQLKGRDYCIGGSFYPSLTADAYRQKRKAEDRVMRERGEVAQKWCREIGKLRKHGSLALQQVCANLKKASLMPAVTVRFGHGNVAVAFGRANIKCTLVSRRIRLFVEE